MTQNDLRALLDYHYWARDRLLAALEPLAPAEFTRDLGNSFRSIRDTTVHVYGAEQIWHSRWTGRSPDALPAAERYPDVSSVRAAWQALEQDVRGFVEALGPDRVGQRFTYRLLNGAEATSAFADMLQHLVNHASYHRGQITTMLRQIGAAPAAPMDLIAFCRIRDQRQQ